MVPPCFCLCSCHDFRWWWTVTQKYNPNNPFPPQVLFVMVFSISTESRLNKHWYIFKPQPKKTTLRDKVRGLSVSFLTYTNTLSNAWPWTQTPTRPSVWPPTSFPEIKSYCTICCFFVQAIQCPQKLTNQGFWALAVMLRRWYWLTIAIKFCFHNSWVPAAFLKRKSACLPPYRVFLELRVYLRGQCVCSIPEAFSMTHSTTEWNRTKANSPPFLN